MAGLSVALQRLPSVALSESPPESCRSTFGMRGADRLAGQHPLDGMVMYHSARHEANVPYACARPMTPQMPDDTHQKVFEFSGNAGLRSGKAMALAR